jgi:site-specific DNA recombinase
MPTRVIGYIRVSTKDQVEEGHSLDAQRSAIIQFCQNKGWQLVEIKVDAGISGTKEKRPALQETLKAVEQGRCDVVVVHAIDRFYRNLQGLLKALNHLQEHNVTFTSISENLDFTTPWGKLALAVLGTLAEIYIDRLRKETRKGRRARVAKGLHNGTPPIGYCYGDCAACRDPNGEGYCPRYGQPNRQDYTTSDPLLPHPIDQVAVRLAFQWHASGHYSDGDIAEMLNDHTHTLDDGTKVSFRTKGRWGRGNPGRFSKDSIRDMLQNPYYAGKVPYYGRNEKGQRRKRGNYVALYSGKHEAIVDEDIFDRSQEIRDLMAHHPRTRGNALERVYPLSGILRCAYCGEVMRAHSSNGRRYYRDKSQVLHLRDCPQNYVQAEEIEANLGQLVDGIVLPPDWRDQVMEGLHPGKSIEEIQDQEKEIVEKMERAKRLYIDGDIGRGRYEREKMICEEAISDLRPVVYDDIIAVGDYLEGTLEQWDTLTLLQQKKRSRKLFATVLVRGDRLVAVQPTKPLYSLIQHSAGLRQPFSTREEGHRISGADGRLVIR